MALLNTEYENYLYNLYYCLSLEPGIFYVHLSSFTKRSLIDESQRLFRLFFAFKQTISI